MNNRNYELLHSNESRARYELAVICRVSDSMGLSDTCGGFSAARIIGENAFVLRGHNQHPGQVTISNLFRCEMNQATPRAKNMDLDAGAVDMIKAIFNARADVNAIMHGHTPASMVFTALDVQLLPMSQFGVMYHGLLNKIPFGAVDNQGWCATMVAALSNNPGVLFSNHGFVAVGKDAKQAMHNFYAIEQAMSVQIGAMKTQAVINVVPELEAKKLRDTYWGGAETEEYDGSREWDAWERLVKNMNPGVFD